MFHTIQRKLFCGVIVVSGMLIAASAGSVYGLYSYRAVIRDLDFAINRAPHQPELAAALSRLIDPLLMKVTNKPGAEFQQQQFLKASQEARGVILDFRRRLEEMPPSELLSGRKLVTDSLLSNLDLRLAVLERKADILVDLDRREAALPPMQAEVARLQSAVHRVPDPVAGLVAELDSARGVYRSTFWIVMSASTLAIALFAWLLRYGYYGIVVPIRQLRQGARRVAQGDYQYRVRLNTHDEMSELAEALNLMTSRFQEVRNDLDRQVRDRSNQLVRSERLAGVGFLSAGVAHEINNPLAAILMAADSIERRFGLVQEKLDPREAEVITRYLQMIQRESERCREITSRLLDFARGQNASRQRTDVTGLVNEVLDMVRHLGKYRTKTLTFLRAQPCFVELHGPEIKQVILNLVANALEAMEEGGHLAIELVDQIDEVCLTFRDNGCGMTQDVIDNLFEPFFTQRRGGQGTGLGLSISHRIVTDHGGTIEATSKGPGEGSVFCVRLPRRLPSEKVA